MRNGLRIAGLGVHTLRNIDLTLEAGQCAGITGPSGAGKTLLLRAIADLDPHQGQVWLQGVAAQDTAPHVWRRRVALLPAETAWWHDMVGAHFKDVGPQWLAALGFEPDVLGWRISRLSSGERQRLGMLRLLMLEPDVLLLDEPTANLDQHNTSRVEDLMTKYRQEQQAIIIWVSHDMQQLQRNCDPIYSIDGDRLRLHQVDTPARGDAQ